MDRVDNVQDFKSKLESYFGVDLSELSLEESVAYIGDLVYVYIYEGLESGLYGEIGQSGTELVCGALQEMDIQDMFECIYELDELDLFFSGAAEKKAVYKHNIILIVRYIHEMRS